LFASQTETETEGPNIGTDTFSNGENRIVHDKDFSFVCKNNNDNKFIITPIPPIPPTPPLPINLDFAVLNQGASEIQGDSDVSILLGNGNGTFGAATDIPVGKGAGDLALGDFNNDGDLDIAVTTINRKSRAYNT
jgi:hypothetical protein